MSRQILVPSMAVIRHTSAALRPARYADGQRVGPRFIFTLYRNLCAHVEVATVVRLSGNIGKDGFGDLPGWPM